MSATDKLLPKYVAYYRDNFMGSARVNRRLNWQQRHIYRALCLEAPFCDTRPYLPDDDGQLALLADVPDEVWAENKDAVLKMFVKDEHGWTHHRIIEVYEKACETYNRFSDLGKASGAARRAKSGTEPSLSDVPPLNARSAHAEEINVNEIKVDEMKSEKTKTSTRINDNDARETPSSLIAESGFAATATPTPPPANGVELSEAEEVVKLLHFLLSQRKDEVKIPASYQKFWLQDFKAALEQHSFNDLRLVVIYSQLPRNQKYYKRSKPICDNFDSLLDQAQCPAGREECKVLWKLAENGRLPAPKKDGSVTEAMAAAPADRSQCRECPASTPAHPVSACPKRLSEDYVRPCFKCPDGVPKHAAGQCPPVDAGLIDMEDL